MKTRTGQPRFRRGYSLGEMLAALVIGAMVLTAILGVYGRANRAAEAVLNKIETPALGAEVLQRIAEDLDRIIGADGNVTVQIRNGFDNGFVTAELIVRRTLTNAENKEQTLEEITWRGGYDYDSAVPGLVIYRSRSGVGLEDKLLDVKREKWESNYSFVPICRGVTYFRIEVPKGDGAVDRWSSPSPPPGVRVTLSFAKPYETVRGTLDVADEEKVGRTIAVDRIRTIRFGTAAGSGTEALGGSGAQSGSDAETKEDSDNTKPESGQVNVRPVLPTRKR
jgi:Tfp pilus assembly protein PilV